MIVIFLMSAVALISNKVFNAFTNDNKRIESDAASEAESLVWMGYLRKNFYVSLLDAESPPELPVLHKVEFNESGLKTVRYDYQLASKLYDLSTIFQIKNKCTPVPASLQANLPTINRNYLAKIMARLGASPACVNDLASLDCGPGQTVSAQLIPETGPNVLQYFPQISRNNSSWKKQNSQPIAGMVCVVKNAYDYMHVQMFSATFDLNFFDNPDKTSALRWSIKKMIFPPPSNGNSQYVR